MSLIIKQTVGGLYTYDYDGLPCGIDWRDRQHCKRAAVATQNIIAGLGLGNPSYTAEVKTTKEAKGGIHKADR